MSQTYEILAEGRAIRCLICGRTSWNTNDVRHRYCGACCLFHDDLTRAEALRRAAGGGLVRSR